jgi:hypothetical protein
MGGPVVAGRLEAELVTLLEGIVDEPGRLPAADRARRLYCPASVLLSAHFTDLRVREA